MAEKRAAIGVLVAVLLGMYAASRGPITHLVLQTLL